MINSKRKGNQGERNWAKFLREQGIDNNARRNVSSGSTFYKSDIHNSINYNFEVKCVKRLNLWNAIKQTVRDAEKSHTKPSVIIHLDGMREDEWWVLIDAYNWADLIKRSKESVIKEPDRETSYIIKNLIIWLKKLDKKLE